ncbi:MAG: transposase [Candidatus Nitrosotenuis sp.]
MPEHMRRDGYWKYYHLAHTQERDFLVHHIVSLVNQNLPAGSKKKSHAGRRPIHSKAKMYCICIIMVAFGLTYRDAQNIIPSLNLPWSEPTPDHTTIARFFGKISVKWLEEILARTAQMCLAESGWKKGLLGSDSTSVATDTYRHEMRPYQNRHEFEDIKIRQYLKWHVVSVLDHLVILCSAITSKKTHDSPVLKTMLNRMKRIGIDLKGSIFDADKGYDSSDARRSLGWEWYQTYRRESVPSTATSDSEDKLPRYLMWQCIGTVD